MGNPKFFDDYSIKLASRKNKKLNRIKTSILKYKYPSFIIKDKNSDYYIEILNKEQDSGSKVQPMLYVRFPSSKLINKNSGLSFVGSSVPSNGIAQLTIDESNIQFFFKTFKVLGCLSESHNKDVKSIIDIL